MIQEQIMNHPDDPPTLERLYRANKKGFKKAFFELLPQLESSPMAAFWKARLDEEEPAEMFARIKISEILILIGCCAFASLLISLPQWLDLDLFKTNLFYVRNAFWIGFAGLSLYTFLSNRQFNTKKLPFFVLAFLIPLVYMNLLPQLTKSHTLNLIYVHMPILLWALFGMVYTDWKLKNKTGRIEFLKHNGELAVLGAILVLAGLILAAVAISMFAVIGISINNFIENYGALCGMVSAPIIAAFMVRIFPAISGKIPPVLARIFTPLVLIILLIYLVAMGLSGKNPFSDRDFLMVFNLMLLGVMGLIFFSVAETNEGDSRGFAGITLFLLSLTALLVNLVALSAIVYRLSEYGLTPNRTAVLGANLLIFTHLIWISGNLFRFSFRKKLLQKVEDTIARFLPVYVFWLIIVVFLFPPIFGWWVI